MNWLRPVIACKQQQTWYTKRGNGLENFENIFCANTTCNDINEKKKTNYSLLTIVTLRYDVFHLSFAHIKNLKMFYMYDYPKR